ncbi:MAG: multidrug resistance efflux transporter family protein [Rhodospirillaceae bacterium]|nr:multidrug resistance efflux transporter family protein [Rhodospirillaceae bacterium]
MFVGALAALFFSTTFVLNRAISLDGGHWFWTAALRYAWMIGFLCAGYLISGKGRALIGVFHLFTRYWKFWCVTGSIGFGVFYAPLSFAASYAPGWMVATTWQTTILCTPLVLRAFGHRVPMRALALTGLIFCGVVLVNIEHARLTSTTEVLLAALPVLLAAFAYPLGNQMLWEARIGTHPRLPHIVDPALDDPFARVLLLSLGSVPFWLILGTITLPPPPPTDQIVTTAFVALFSGVIATSLFLYARHIATSPAELAAADCTQALEVVFSLAGEVWLLGGALPSIMGWAGLALTIIGLLAYLRAQR